MLQQSRGSRFLRIQRHAANSGNSYNGYSISHSLSTASKIKLVPWCITKTKYAISSFYSKKAKSMPGERTDGDRASTQTSQSGRIVNQEHIRTALALLLGPETEYALRIRASQRLARQGTDLLPLLLTTLNNYPEITSPPWPWWPPQYEHLSRLLLLLSQRAQVPLETLLQH